MPDGTRGGPCILLYPYFNIVWLSAGVLSMANCLHMLRNIFHSHLCTEVHMCTEKKLYHDHVNEHVIVWMIMWSCDHDHREWTCSRKYIHPGGSISSSPLKCWMRPGELSCVYIFFTLINATLKFNSKLSVQFYPPPPTARGQEADWTHPAQLTHAP